jgi:hypothetical protein
MRTRFCGKAFTEPLPSNDRKDTHTQFVVETSSGAMIYIPSFIKIGSGIQKLIGEYTQTAW